MAQGLIAPLWSHTRSTRHAASYASLVVLVLMLGYFVFFEAPSISYPRSPQLVEADLPALRPGAPIRMRIWRCSAERGPRVYMVAHLLHGPKGPPVVLPAQPVTLLPGCHEVTVPLGIVPADADDGQHWVEGIAEIGGQVRNVSVRWTSLPFRVENEVQR